MTADPGPTASRSATERSVCVFRYLPGRGVSTQLLGKAPGATDHRSAAAPDDALKAALPGEGGGRPPAPKDGAASAPTRGAKSRRTAALLEGVGVTKNFGGLRVLHDVSFRVGEGEIVALIGPNGAGKTTLFNAVNGLVRPSKGFIGLAGRRLTTLPPHEISRLGVGRTFQTPRPFQDMSVIDNVQTAIRFSRHPRAEARHLLELLGLGDQASIPARRLPTTRRKRLELAMALALQPRVLLLDEILGGLTRADAAEFTGMLRHIRDEWGTALFWIDHVMWAVMQTAERAIVLHHGEVIAEGDPLAVSRDSRVISAYLGPALEPQR